MNDINKKFNLKTIVLIIISISLLLIASSISVYYLYLLPKQQSEKLEFEKQKYEDALNQKEEEKKKEEEKALNEELKKIEQQTNLDNCISDSQLTYSIEWANYCKIWKEEVDKAWTDCRSNIYSWQTDEQNKQFCITSTPDYREDDFGSCLLPNKYSQDVEDNLEKSKAECYLKYPIN
jgi:flagellar basal body-associated protein FliL